MKRIILLLAYVIFLGKSAHSQCAAPINTFPYNEDFELNNGSWVSGGIANDWAWGSPSKAIIQTAGGGAKCWITGGLAGSFYNLNERSYLLSPCFDFTNIQYPHIKFKIYWETENSFDGATLQYSTNNGATWTNVGAYNDPVNCNNENWFNQPNINALNTMASPLQGWAGTSLPTAGSCIGGAGSMGWVTAKHSMPYLAGQPSVLFRFAFGAGSVCNNYDGVAIDDVTIQDAPPAGWVSVAPNNISCNGNNSGSINALASGAAVITYHLDPVNLTNINGTFNSLYAGSYTVTATDANGCSVTSYVLLIQPSPIIFVSNNVTNLQCFNDASGAINVQFNGGIGGVDYTLFPGGQVSPNGLFTGLNAGNYTIVATDATGCTKTTTATLTQPPQIIVSEMEIKTPGCNPNNDGRITVHAYGGVGGLTYSNGAAFSSDSVFSNLTAGTYTITIKDATGCSITTTAVLLNVNAPVFVSVNSTAVGCADSHDGSISVTANANVPVALYELDPGNLTNISGLFNNLAAGIYTITVSDISSCSNTTVVHVLAPEKIIFQSLTYTAGNCGSNLDARITAVVSGGVGNKIYTLLPINAVSNDGSFAGIQTAGSYTVIATDANQCSAVSSLKLEERICCDNLILPNAFSPNNDMKNDEFRILNRKGIDLKEFIIYNRWGDVAFNSQHIDDSWDGKTKGMDAEVGNYFYLIKYTCLSTGKENTVKGDVMLVR